MEMPQNEDVISKTQIDPSESVEDATKTAPNLNGDKEHSQDKENNGVINAKKDETPHEDAETKIEDVIDDNEVSNQSYAEDKMVVDENQDVDQNRDGDNNTTQMKDDNADTATEQEKLEIKEITVTDIAIEIKKEDESTDTPHEPKEIDPKARLPRGRKRKLSEKLEEAQDDKFTEGEEVKVKEEPLDMDLYPPGTIDELGKGKRARIPNKRYSDILVSPTYNKKNLTPQKVENGNIEKVESGNETDTSSQEFGQSPRSGSPSLKRPKIDLGNPKYLKPFKFGWRRELVWRATYDVSKGKMGDIYYYTPEGIKVRSTREVGEHLNNKELTLENFSFFKAPIGIADPSKETIRNAAKLDKHSNSLAKQAAKKSLKNAQPLSPKITTSPKPAVTKPTSPKLTGSKVLNIKLINTKMSSPKPSTSKQVSPKLASPSVSRSKVTRSKALLQKEEPNETADSPPKARITRNTKDIKIKSPIKSPMKKDVNRSPEKATPQKMEVDSSPPKPTPKRGRPPRKAPVEKPPASPVATKPALKKRTIKMSNITSAEEKDKETKFMDNYLQNISYGYNTLLYVFQYLKVQDLLRAGCVSTMWRDIASHPMLWRTVRMKNSQVHSFEGLANSLKKHGTRHLDLRKMLLPNGGDEIWPEFSKAIAKVDTLRRIELCRCPAAVVEKLATSNPQLEVINAVTIKCENLNLEPLKALTAIRELRLKSTGGITLTSNLDSLREMKELKHLSLTSIRDLDRMNLNVIAELSNLESLDLGECTDFPKNFGSEILVKLKSLERLRLEKGQGNCHTFEILEAVKDMDHLEQLELVNFDIKAGFDKALGACENLKKLLIIPTYISQSATTNHMVLGGVLRLQNTLSHFVWGVTLELLRVTELFVDQCEEPKDKKDKKFIGNGDCIPVLKPVPLLEKDSEIAPAIEPPQVEILALPNLQKLLMQNLPTTRVKILKIPFHATWRQSITDSVN